MNLLDAHRLSHPRTTREHGVEYTRGFVHDGRHIVSQVVGPHKVDTMSNDLYRRLCDNELKSKIDSINKAYSYSAHDAKNHWVRKQNENA